MSNPNYVPLPPNPAQPGGDQHDSDPYQQTAGQTPGAQPTADPQNAFPAVPPAPGPDPSSQFPPAPNIAPPAPASNAYTAPAPNAYTAPAGLYRSAPSLDEPYYGCPIFEAYIRFWQKYVVLSGRASRSEFWWPFLCNIVIGAVLGFIVGIIYNATGADLGFLTTVYELACFIPGLSLGVRRLHDTNRPGWWLAIIYGVAVLAGILIVAGGASFIIGGVGSMFGGGRGFGVAAAGGSALLIFGVLLSLAASILWAVLMALPSNPEGARFDKHAAVAPYGAPVAGAPNAAPVYSTSTPGYGAAPMPPAGPFGAPAPAAPFAVPAPADPFAVQAEPDVPSAAPAPVPAAPDAAAPQQPSDAPATQPAADDDMDATQPSQQLHSDGRQTPQAPYAQPGQQPWQGK
ncbi:DUF805 domain-containing protein [Bifidobacterium aesculapii]|uniref:DUF805 domain-containing protein n=1 Tax=Bifidobacterium aesculapii TaxID=1329411 RepID=UPI0006E2C7BE|nr:DUF805 domain-containing protein [Bifidobacterium aesculapii]